MSNTDILQSIGIENIKGIGSEEFKLNLNPNKPCIFVAPNGFGKSSLARAFVSLNKTKIILKDTSDIHEYTNANSPKITIELDKKQFLATDSSNEISKKISSFVIANSLYAQVRNRGGNYKATASIQIKPVVLVDKIPKRDGAPAHRNYLDTKPKITKLLKSMNSSQGNIEVHERKGQLIATFPDAQSISNGQRDILSFIAQIFEARHKFNQSKKKHCLLIIDEIFDYLDDANLVAFQYYIVELIKEFKSNGKYLYPILLTHLDPIYFYHYIFGNHRLQIRYFGTGNPIASNFLELVKKRGNKSIEKAVDKHFFHYHPQEKDIENELKKLGLNQNWGKSHSFYCLLVEEMEKYLENEDADLIGVLFALRITIEKLAYDKVTTQKRRCSFLKTHKTTNKLDFCGEINIDIPDTYYMLGIIYNEHLHPNTEQDKKDYLKFLNSKLSNPAIKSMIKEIWDDLPSDFLKCCDKV